MDKNDFRKALKQDVKEMRRNKIVSALLFVVIGVVLLAWPGQTLVAVSKGIGLILAVGGIAAVVMYFINGSKAVFSYAGLVGGVIVGVLGLWLFFNPAFLINLIPTIVGVILVISGLVNLSEGIALKKNHDESVLLTIILAVISVLLGLFILVFQMQFAELITRLMGIALVYDGVTDLIMISKLTGIVRTIEYAAKQAVQDANPLDVTATVKDVTPASDDVAYDSSVAGTGPADAEPVDDGSTTADAPAEETPAADGFPVEGPADEAPAAEETPVDETPAEEAPAEEENAPAEEVTSAEEAAEEPSVEETSTEEVTSTEEPVTAEETPAETPDPLVAEPDEFELEDEPTEAPTEETPTEEEPSETETLFDDNNTAE